jgi:hypothetical protein
MAKQEYNFTPDYAYWWDKKDLSIEDTATLIFGLKPDEYDWYVTCHNALQDIQGEEFLKFQSLREYLGNREQCNALYDIIELREHILSESYYNRTSPKDFLRSVYESGMKYGDRSVHKGFLDFLESRGEHPHHFDFLKDKSRYHFDYGDLKSNLPKSEDDAVSIFLGLKAEPYNQFIAMKKDWQWVQWSPEKRFFAREYRKILDALPVSIGRLDDIKALNLWKGDFKEYVKTLHNHGVVFSPSFMRAFKKHVLPDWEWGYDEDSKIWQFYHHWVKRVPTWTLEEAVDLFKGYDPIIHQSHIINLAVSEFLLSSHPNGQEKNSPRILQAYEKYPFAQTGLHIIELQERLQRYVAAGKTQIAHQPFQDRPKEGWLFEPKAIYRFLNEATLYQPPLALHSAVGDTFEGYLDKQDSNVRETDDGPVLKNRLDSNTHDSRRKELERLKDKMQQAGIQDGEYSQDDMAIFLEKKSLHFNIDAETIKHYIKQSKIFQFPVGRQSNKKKQGKIPLGNRINWDE